MAYDASARRSAAEEAASDELWRNVGKWGAAMLLFLATLALLTSLSLFQMTAAGPAKQTLRRSIAALTEIDVLIDRRYGDLRQSAQASGADESVRLEGFPIDVPLSRDDVLGGSKEDLRSTLLDRSADELYRSGTAPLRSTADGKGSVGRFSVAGLTDDGLGFLRGRNHTVLGILTFAFAAICAALAGLLAWLSRGFGRLASVGAVILAAASPVAAGAIGARFYMRIVAEGDTEYLQGEFLAVGRAMVWIPIRDGLAFAVLGATFLALGVACAFFADRRSRTAVEGTADAPRLPSREPSMR